MFLKKSILLNILLLLIPFLLHGFTNQSIETGVAQKKTLPKIELKISEQSMSILMEDRKKALVLSQLISQFKSIVPAILVVDGKDYPVEVKLKGIFGDHWKNTNALSFRVIVKSGTVLGMKAFSLQHPARRQYLNEWLYHKALEHFGLIATKYEFVRFSLNNKSFGTYAIEEVPDKYLIERNKMREGVVLRFEDDYLWNNYLLNREGANIENLNLCELKPYNGKRVLKKKELRKQYTIASQLMHGFIHRKFTTSEVFNIEKLALCFALTADLFGQNHALQLPNLRFYYNPISSKIEPVGFDITDIKKRKVLLGTHMNYLYDNYFHNDSAYPSWYRTFFKDRAFFDAYVQALKKLQSKETLDEFFATINEDFIYYSRLLKKQFPKFKANKNLLYFNQNNIQKQLQTNFTQTKKPEQFPKGKIYQKGLDWKRVGIQAAYVDYDKKSHQLIIKVGNYSSDPVELINIRINKNYYHYLTQKVTLPPKLPYYFIKHKEIRLDLAEEFVWSKAFRKKITIFYQLAGTKEVDKCKVLPFPFFEESTFENDLFRKQANYTKFSFIEVDEKNKVLKFKKGDWQIEEHLLIPKGYTVQCEKGTVLTLKKKTSIISYAPFQFKGSKQAPIIIQSKDKKGSGLLILETQGQVSSFEHVHFKQLSNPKTDYWTLTGAVTLYEAPVTFNNCEFIDNQSEDALNIVRSSFELNNCHFKNIFSDAFDADFCTGNIKKCTVINCLNDGIDVSGSEVNIDEVSMDGLKDKGISSGENSNVVAKNIQIQNAEIGLAAKDLSTLTIDNVSVKDSEIGCAVYQKKPEFGPATITIKNGTFENNKQENQIEAGSTLVIDGQKKIDNKHLLYETMYKAKEQDYSDLEEYIAQYPTKERYLKLSEYYKKRGLNKKSQEAEQKASKYQ